MVNFVKPEVSVSRFFGDDAGQPGGQVAGQCLFSTEHRATTSMDDRMAIYGQPGGQMAGQGLVGMEPKAATQHK